MARRGVGRFLPERSPRRGDPTLRGRPQPKRTRKLNRRPQRPRREELSYLPFFEKRRPGLPAIHGDLNTRAPRGKPQSKDLNSKRRKQSGRNFAKNAKQPRAGQSGSLKWMARWVLMGGWPSVSKRLHEKRERQNCVNSERTDAGTPARSFCRRRQLSGISG
jgi:hypothetical protein